MANRNPIKTAEFLAHIKKPQEGDLGVKLADKAYGVKLPGDVAAILDGIPQRSAWLRRVITEAARRELFGQPPGTVSENPPPPAAPDMSPMGEMDWVAQRIAEVLRMPYVPMDARRKLKLLLEAVGSRANPSGGHR